MRPVDVPIYDFRTHQRSTETRRVPAADVVIMEGILVLHMPEIRDMLNMKIFVDTDDDVRLARRCVGAGKRVRGGVCAGGMCCSMACSHAVLLPEQRHLPMFIITPPLPLLHTPRSIQRDVAVRGRDVGGVIEQYTRFVKPAFDQYVAPSRKHADVIIPWQRCDNM